jgi:response regulator RpfG family c-di-GMP phosphodiesterase
MSDLEHGSELATVYRLAAAVERRDGETHAHTLRVGRAASMLAEAIGLSEREVEMIKLAAPLHDIGKVGVPDAILSKPGPLTEEEWVEMRAHAHLGHQILQGSECEVLRLASEIALTHHEWWDGAGYPCGLEEEQIPLAGRLTAVTDAFDAMTHGRPYKPAWSIEEGLAELSLSAGVQFDPWLVEAFSELDHSLLLSLDERVMAAPQGAAAALAH